MPASFYEEQAKRRHWFYTVDLQVRGGLYRYIDHHHHHAFFSLYVASPDRDQPI